MSGETRLEILLKSMKPILKDGEFVFCTLSQQYLEELELKPLGWFQEDEGITVILPRQQAESFGLQYSYIARMITLSVHSSLDAVGFLAAITGKLSQFGISVNPISAYYHDHLFVPSEKAHEVMRILAEFNQ
ncbi:MAG: ACT domain-containing protein [Xenococcaceae cyanobacterium MO_188.B29]|nr:ACT domain-containing protein [Xenococcaceae cyanobacterium MO_188.B29]